MTLACILDINGVSTPGWGRAERRGISKKTFPISIRFADKIWLFPPKCLCAKISENKFITRYGKLRGINCKRNTLVYSRLSLSRNRRDPQKQFEISVLRHIRFVVLRKKQFEQPIFTNDYVI